MSIYTQTVLSKLAAKPITDTTCTLSVTGGVSYTFLINPGTITASSTSEFSSISVLKTPQPLLKYKHSLSSLSFPKLLFWTPGDAYDVTNLIVQLESWVRTATELELNYGYIDRKVYIKKFDYSVSQLRSGQPTKAEGSMELLLIATPMTPLSTKQPLTVTPTAREKSKSTK